MKFVFEATAAEFDLAAEQEILLRHLSKRRRNWGIAACLCVVTAAAAVILTRMHHGTVAQNIQVALLVIGVILMEQGYMDYTSGNPKAYLKALYRGRNTQTAAELNKTLRVVIGGEDTSVRIYDRDTQMGEWDFSRLCRVTESDEIFDLVCAGAPMRYLALPKDALREGTADEFRQAMSERLGGRTVERYHVSKRRKGQLMAAKYQLFKH